MNLLVFMYHRARLERHGNAPAMLDAHFAHVARHYANVMPGEPLQPGRLNVCLTFDDGYYDFYARVFPLLRRHQLRAQLAIPSSLVPEGVAAPAEKRLGVASTEAFADPEKGGLCTWSELQEMAQSGHVTLAAHGHTHTRIDGPEADLVREVHTPAKILGARCGRPVESFVFPYGRFSGASLYSARQHYRYVFRIGGAANRAWNQRLLYRISGDVLSAPASPFSPARLARYRTYYLWNRLRRR